jgi:DHA2 family multidrug resistance protein
MRRRCRFPTDGIRSSIIDVRETSPETTQSPDRSAIRSGLLFAAGPYFPRMARPTPTPSTADRRQRTRVIALTLLLNAMAVMSFRVLSLATPYIGQALSLTDDEELWLSDAYLVALICVALFSGWAMARLGYRRLLLASVIGTSVLSLLVMVTTHLPTLVAICFLLGIFSGAVAPTTQAMVLRHFQGNERGQGMAIWGAGSTIGLLAGALACGFLIESFSWRVPFLLAIPLGLPALALLRDVGDDGREQMRVDLTEVLMLTMAVLSFSAFINFGDNYAWFDSPVIVAIAAVFVASLLLYVDRIRRTGRSMIDYTVLRDRKFAVALLLTVGVAFFCSGQFETDMLGGMLHDSPELIGMRGTLGGIAITAGVMLGGRLIARYRTSTVILASFVITLIGKFGFTFYGPDVTPFMAIWPQVISGLGIGLMSTPIAVAAFDTLPSSKNDQGSSLFVLSSRLGSAVGVAVLGVALDHLQADAGGSRHIVESTGPFLTIFWIELIGTAAFIPFSGALGHAPEAAAFGTGGGPELDEVPAEEQ